MHWLDHPDMPDAQPVRDRGRYSKRASSFLGGWRMWCWKQKVSLEKATDFATKKHHPAYWISRGYLAAKATAEAGQETTP